MMKGMAVVKKTSKFTKDILTGIITGIVSTLIISWFITPLTNLIFPKVIVFLENISMPFVDYLYRCAATYTIERTGLLNLTFSSTCTLFCIFSSTFLFSSIKSETQDKLDKVNNLLDPPQEMSSNQRLQSLKEDKRYFQKTLKLYKKLSTAYLVSILLTCIMILFSEMAQIYEASISTVTRTNIEIVSPYISDQEYKQLKSDFFLIKTKDDYDNLQKELEIISENNQVDLKE